MNYLYNGVPLPPLPYRDKETHPYAYIGCRDDIYYLCYSTVEFTVTAENKILTGINTYKAADGLWVDSNFNINITVIWSDHDVYYKEDGTLYLAASEPVPILEIQIPKGVDRYSYIVGFNLGLAGMAYPYSAPTPIAYLYNGIRLPDINAVWTDKETYPYAFILRSEVEEGDIKVGDILLYLSEAKGEFIDLTQAYVIMQPSAVHRYRLQNNQYDYMGVEDSDGMYALQYDGLLTLLWNSHDICKIAFSGSEYVPTDEVVLAASEPVPVYE